MSFPRIRFTLLLSLLVACAGGSPTTADPRGGDLRSPGGRSGSGMGAGFWLDMSPTNRYQEIGTHRATVSGRAEGTDELRSVQIDEMPSRITDGTSFSGEVPVATGVQTIPVVAEDLEGMERKGHRSIIVADYLPEGELNRDATFLVVSQALANAMAGDLAVAVPDVDLGAEIMARPTLMDDGMCTIRPVSASAGPPRLNLAVRGGQLVVEISFGTMNIQFAGECRNLLTGSFDVTGSMRGMPVIEAPVSGRAPDDSCLVGLQTSGVTTRVDGWNFSFEAHGLDLLPSLLVGLFAGGTGDDARTMLGSEISMTARPLIEEQIADIEIFNSTSTMNLFQRDAELELCTTFLGPMGGQLVAGVGARVTGGGSEPAPGAPLLPGDVPAPVGNVMLLDSQLVTQLLFSAWRDGGLNTRQDAGQTFGLLAALPGNEELVGLLPDETPIFAETVAELPPVLRAARPEDGEDADLVVIIPDMRLNLTAGDTYVFGLMATITLPLSLVPNDAGELVPVAGEITSEVHMMEEPLGDVRDSINEVVVTSSVKAVAAGMLDGTTIALPDVGGGALVPVDVTPEAGGRFLIVQLR